MAYDYRSAQERRRVLVANYRKLKRHQVDDGTWSWWLIGQIEEIDDEIADAHCADKQKTPTACNSGHPVNRIEKIVNSIVPQ